MCWGEGGLFSSRVRVQRGECRHFVWGRGGCSPAAPPGFSEHVSLPCSGDTLPRKETPISGPSPWPTGPHPSTAVLADCVPPGGPLPRGAKREAQPALLLGPDARPRGHPQTSIATPQTLPGGPGPPGTAPTTTALPGEASIPTPILASAMLWKRQRMRGVWGRVSLSGSEWPLLGRGGGGGGGGRPLLEDVATPGPLSGLPTI